MIPHDLDDVLRDLPELGDQPTATTEEEADAAVRMISSIGPCSLGVMRFSGQAPWERHPDGDELLHVLEGAIDLTVLTDDGCDRAAPGCRLRLRLPERTVAPATRAAVGDDALRHADAAR